MTLEELQAKVKRGERLVMLTAYDYCWACQLDEAGVDLILVGDSLGMVILGYATTQRVTMEEMLHHARAVRRGVRRAVVVGDLPAQVLEASPVEAVRQARRFLEDAGCAAVKIEWRSTILPLVTQLVREGVPVMGHVGLTPQLVADPKDFRVQGTTAEAAAGILQAARALERAGCFSVVLECIPTEVARTISEQLEIPTIGIGAGPYCDGQVLVSYDLVGLVPHFMPKFVKKYTDWGTELRQAVAAFTRDVAAGQFPSDAQSYRMTEPERCRWLKLQSSPGRPSV